MTRTLLETFKKRSVAYIILVFGICVSILAFWYANKNLQEREQLRFEAIANQITTLIKSRMDGYRQILYAGIGFFESSDLVTREEWRSFVASMHLQENYKGIQGVGYSEVIDPKERQKHVERIRAEGFSEYQLRPEGERDLYTSIIYLEPFDERNRRAFGYDMFSEEVRRAAMTQAILTQKAATSGKVRLVQENSIDEQAGFLMYLPLYHKNMPKGNEAELKAAIKGFVYAPFRAKDLMQGVMGNRYNNVSLDIYDGQEIDEKNLLYREDPEIHNSEISLVTKIHLDGRMWTLLYKPLPSFFDEIQRGTPWFILIIGILISFALFSIMISLVLIKDKAQNIADKITEKLSTSEERLRFALEGSGDGIWDWNLGTDEVFFSKRWKEMLGFEEDEIKASLDEWKNRVHPDDLPQVMQDVKKHLERNTQVYINEHRVLCKDGSYKWILDRGMVVAWDKDGNPLRMVGSHTDISAEKAALAKVAASELRFRKLFENMSSGVAIYQPFHDGEDFIFQDINHAVEVIEGLKYDDVIGKKLTQLFPGIKKMGLFDVMQKVYQSGESEFFPSSLYDDGIVSGWRENYVYKISSGEIVCVYNDVTDKKRAEEEILDAKEQFELAISGTNDGIWDWNIQTSHLFMSKRWKEILGYQDDELEEHIDTFMNLIHLEDKQRVMQYVQDYLEGKFEKYELEARLWHKNGHIIWTLSKGQALRDAEGKPYRMAGSISDITERRQVQEQLIQAKEAAEEANISKSRFLANMSHEIRTPMNAILGLSQLLLDENLQTKEKDLIGKIYSSSKMLLGIINDILDYSKIEANKLELEFKTFSLENILAQQRVLFAESKINKGVELYFHAKKDLPSLIVGDELRLDQVLSNLLSNALKFTHKGKVVLSISLERKYNDRAVLFFSVSDSGIGLSQEEIGKLFQPFTQADNSTTRKYGGSGLGLAISRKLVSAMGGELSVLSTKGEGSVFSFAIDFQVVSWNKVEKNKDHSNYRVLVVDDQEISRMILREMLEGFKCKVSEARNGFEALEMIRKADRKEEPYDVVLMDWKMPMMDGLEAIEQINKLVEEKELSVKPASLIMVSGYNAQQIDREQLGIQVVLSKPITSSSLFDTLMSLENGIIRDVHEGLDTLTPHLEGLRVLVVEDNALNQEVVTLMLQRVGAEVKVANNGKEAVEIFKGYPHRFDLILMDLQMPLMGGYEATKIIRESDTQIPIIALTAAATVEDKSKVLAAGMNDHLGKPIDRSMLYELMAKWCHREIDIIPSKTAKKEEAVVFDEEYAVGIANGNKELLRKLLVRFIAQLEGEFDNLASKIEQNEPDIGASIHALKGVSGNLGAKKLFQTCTTIDALLKKNEIVSAELQHKLSEDVRILKEKLRIIVDSKEVTKEEPSVESGMLEVLLRDIREDLAQNNIISMRKQSQLKKLLEEIVDANELKLWSEAMDDFEYKKALELMNGWNI